MRFRTRISVVTLGILLLAAGLSDAQERFIGAAGIASWQAEGEDISASPSVPRGPIGGHGFGIGVGGGFDVKPRVRFGVELTIPSRISAVQGSFRSLHEVAFRDVILSPMLRFGRPIVLVAGISWVFESTVTRSRDRDFPSGALGPLSGPESSVRQTWAYTLGVDAPIGIGSHVQLVPQLRVIDRARPGDGHGTLGLDPFVVRPAIALVVTSSR